MAGLTEDELNSYLPTPMEQMGNAPDAVRARAVMRDIYARHGIPEGTDPATAMQMVQGASEGAWGAQPSAWANPEERANARAEYAARGANPDEVQKRWEESIYLVDPDTQEFRQRFLRDKEFLERMSARDGRDAETEAWTGKPDAGRLTQARTQMALEAWDKTNNNPLYRDNWRDSGGWKGQEGLGAGFANAAMNPDTTVGRLMQHGDGIFNFLAMQGSGETPTTSESWRTAVGGLQSNLKNRPFSDAPMLDLPSSATQEERAARLRELQKEAATAAVPENSERWARSGLLPPPVIRDAGDAVLATLDGTQFLPGATLVKGAVKGAAKQAATKLALDMGSDAATSTAIAMAANQKPNRTWAQYLGLADEDPDAVHIKTDAQVEEANEARRQQFDRTLGAAGVSTADGEAYKKLQQSGRAPMVTRY